MYPKGIVSEKHQYGKENLQRKSSTFTAAGVRRPAVTQFVLKISHTDL